MNTPIIEHICRSGSILSYSKYIPIKYNGIVNPIILQSSSNKIDEFSGKIINEAKSIMQQNAIKQKSLILILLKSLPINTSKEITQTGNINGSITDRNGIFLIMAKKYPITVYLVQNERNSKRKAIDELSVNGFESVCFSTTTSY